MTGLAALTTAVLLLVVFLVVREVQHKRHVRERQALIRRADEVLFGLETHGEDIKSLQNENAAARLLDAAMRETIHQGLELRQRVELQQTHLAELVRERRGQIAVEVSTLETWAKVRDDLTAWADKYHSYMFTSEGGEG